METRKVPAHALRLNVGDFELGDNGEGSLTAPLHLKALGGEVIEHRYFGPIIHDLAGMSHKQRIAVDYIHNPSEIVGYVNKFSATTQLDLDGALIPFKDSDRATEIIYKMKLGVPYQASIDYVPTTPGEIQMEELLSGESATVNGQVFSGPLMIVRKWTLGGVAVVPRGADGDTEAYLQSNGTEDKEINIMETKETKPVDAKDAEKVKVEGEEEAKAEENAEEKKPVEAENAEGEVEEKDKEVTDPKSKSDDCKLSRQDFLDMSEKYGKEKAADYFQQGLSIADAAALFVKTLKEENESLKEQLSSAGSARHAGHDGTDDRGEKEQYVLPAITDANLKQYCIEQGKDFAEMKLKLTKKG